MNKVEAALTLWGLTGQPAQLIAARENAVYRVGDGGAAVALRVHRQGYRTNAQLRSELEWMAVLAEASISVPNPIASLSGQHLHIVGGRQVDVLSWLDGAPLAEALPVMAAQDRIALFQTLGAQMAKLHLACDAWCAPPHFSRPAWDRAGLLGESPLWDRFWENKGLSQDAQALLREFRSRANAELQALTPTLDYGLIHADLVPGNVMVDGDTLHLIDFDDGGYGFRLFEIATALLKLRDETDFDVLKQSLIAGYLSVRDIGLSALDLFMALRAVTYVGWNMSRSHEDETGTRNARFVAQAEQMVHAYLGT